VSVVIPAYNKAELTVQTVESVLSQTYKNIEIIVVDDGSTDSTRDRLFGYTERIRYIYKKNGGACSARNVGISFATGEYVGFLDCDDLYLPEKIELSIRYLEQNPDVGFVYSAAYFIDAQGTIVSTYSHPGGRKNGWIYNDLVVQNFICNSTVMVRKICLDTMRGFDESVFSPADWDMWLRLSEQYTAGYIDVPLTKYRVDGSYIVRNLQKVESEEMQILQQAFRRSTALPLKVKQEALAKLYLRFALNYLFTGDVNNARRVIWAAVYSKPLDLKVLVVFILFYCARSPLRSLIKRRVYLRA